MAIPRNGRSVKQKGSNYERELVNQARERGVAAERAYASNGRALGECEQVDAVIGGKRVQAKRRAKIASWLQVPEGCDAVAVRQDGGQTVVVVNWLEWLELVSKKDEVIEDE